jgi:hypothetical protein
MYNATQKLENFALATSHYPCGEGKGKGKVRPRTGHEGP